MLLYCLLIVIEKGFRLLLHKSECHYVEEDRECYLGPNFPANFKISSSTNNTSILLHVYIRKIMEVIIKIWTSQKSMQKEPGPKQRWHYDRRRKRNDSFHG